MLCYVGDTCSNYRSNTGEYAVSALIDELFYDTKLYHQQVQNVVLCSWSLVVLEDKSIYFWVVKRVRLGMTSRYQMSQPTLQSKIEKNKLLIQIRKFFAAC